MRYASVTLIAALGLACQQSPPQQQAQAAPPAGPAKGTPEWKIQDAQSAAPPAIANGAAIMDFPATEGGEPTQLKAGTNGWWCVPDDPRTPGDDPVCLDAAWQQWARAWMAHTAPQLRTVGVSYMLRGGTDASNTDPFATQPDSGAEWVVSGPHIMIAVPDPTSLDSLPTDYTSGAPYVMWKGTPYAHIMVPVK